MTSNVRASALWIEFLDEKGFSSSLFQKKSLALRFHFLAADFFMRAFFGAAAGALRFLDVVDEDVAVDEIFGCWDSGSEEEWK